MGMFFWRLQRFLRQVRTKNSTIFSIALSNTRDSSWQVAIQCRMNYLKLLMMYMERFQVNPVVGVPNRKQMRRSWLIMFLTVAVRDILGKIVQIKSIMLLNQQLYRNFFGSKNLPKLIRVGRRSSQMGVLLTGVHHSTVGRHHTLCKLMSLERTKPQDQAKVAMEVIKDPEKLFWKHRLAPKLLITFLRGIFLNLEKEKSRHFLQSFMPWALSDS